MSQDSSGVVSSTVRRWQLAETLRQLREAAGLTMDQAIDELRKRPGRWSRPKLSRIENRVQGVKPREVEQLLDVYGVTDPKTRTLLLELAQTANERGWWLAYRRDLPEDFHPYLSMEVAAVALRQFETMLVPGLLQTADYTRALVNGIYPGTAPDKVERIVAARMARQQILTRENPPQFHVILDQNVLERPVGRLLVMRHQLRRLVEASELPNITVQVLPRSAGAHPGMEGPFTILSLPEPLPDIGYTEGIGGSVYLERQDHVRVCTMRFAILTKMALSPEESVDLITKAAKDFE
ncbi:helix-turn-helix domain-containing protein [Carbonactinospora thermoautotrophica]|uniref:helix-turn-helix domain-containing protein n=1 Tax=Carbonactinospora thermoautotrophica TaxID=1469144 RepID=UPI002270C5C8|nr:helix-turn-helix transcriptional regulator [Carbonactinospora thermoautotrophica]